MMSTFIADLETRLAGRLAELDSERGRIVAALGALSPEPEPAYRITPASAPALPRAPRGANRRLILEALREHGPLPVRELHERTGIARTKLASTLTAMKSGRRVALRAGQWSAR